MWKLLLLCYVTCCFLLGHAVAEGEPTTLRGGVLQASDNCRAKVSKNARIKLHYTARTWQGTEPYESTYSGSPVSYTIGRDKIMKGWPLIGIVER
ncbi:hypothetical protein BJV82DRAFT_630527 [Fennellomyces sp. T-0311]|nr:hypothetical protein BJV82DRAFT_630527 [Fennellomyces sp. T-0311]